MSADEVIAHLKTQSVQEIVQWMVENMSHESLKQCLRKIENETGESPKKKKKSSSKGSKKKAVSA